MLGMASIARVVSVDDRYAKELDFEDYWAMAQAMPGVAAEQLEGISAEDIRNSPSAVRARIEQVWGDSDEVGRRRHFGSLARALEDDAGVDDASLDILRQTLSGHDQFAFAGLSMAEWREQREALIGDGLSTLLLVDLNFEGEGYAATDGLRIVREIFDNPPGVPWLCGLLLRTESEQAIWEGLGDQGVDPDRVVVISKKRLLDDPMGFVRRVKMTLLAPACRELTTKAQAILTKAHGVAGDAISENVHMYDYEHIVFVRSQEEGVWEPDTLFRLYGMYAQKESRRLARQDEDILRLTTQIRALVAVDTGDPPAEEHTSWRIQRVELYEDPQYLQALHLPLELGDIFERPDVSEYRYVLLSQPCDLMLRGDGRRRLELATLAAISIKALVGDGERLFRLPFFGETDGADAWVDLDKVYPVSLDILDLCAVTEDGKAAYRRSAVFPSIAIEPARARYSDLVTLYDAGLKNHKLLLAVASKADGATAAVISASALGALPGSPHRFARPTVHQIGSEVSFAIRRIGRLNYNWAQDLLLRFVQHQGRLALEMELGRPRARGRRGPSAAQVTGPS
jgi:hypothetical protein